MHALYSKPQLALENAIKEKRLSKSARLKLLQTLMRDLFVSDAFATVEHIRLPPHEVAALQSLEKQRFLLVQAVEQNKAGREGRICFIRDIMGRLAVN